MGRTVRYFVFVVSQQSNIGLAQKKLFVHFVTMKLSQDCSTNQDLPLGLLAVNRCQKMKDSLLHRFIMYPWLLDVLLDPFRR